jgi:hypothetical protein
MDDLRRPGQVPDELPYDVGSGVDTDGDGRSDTVVTDDGVDLVVAIDLDGDRLADHVLRIGPDGLVREVDLGPGADVTPEGAEPGAEA